MNTNIRKVWEYIFLHLSLSNNLKLQDFYQNNIILKLDFRSMSVKQPFSVYLKDRLSGLYIEIGKILFNEELQPLFEDRSNQRCCYYIVQYSDTVSGLASLTGVRSLPTENNTIYLPI